jgi:hypothetical protein
MLVIDEVTHLSSLQIQLLAKWCEVNDTKLILIGDNKQLGYDGRGRNIQREQCIIARSQDLGISLRDNNI